MVPTDLNPEPGDRRADLYSRWLAALLIGASFATQGWTKATDAARAGLDLCWQHVWLLEGTSHAAILVLMPLTGVVLDRTVAAVGANFRIAAIHVAASILFSLVHVVLMLAARLALFPPFLDYAYEVDLLAPHHLAYEFAKDVFTYALLVLGFLANRTIERRRFTTSVAKVTALASGKVALAIGGSKAFVAVGDVTHAKAAENYVEVYAAGTTHLARMTLTRLAQELAAHGPQFVRVHRSDVVNLAEVAAIVPTGEGDVTITLKNGIEIPGSRRYRGNLNAVAG